MIEPNLARIAYWTAHNLETLPPLIGTRPAYGCPTSSEGFAFWLRSMIPGYQFDPQDYLARAMALDYTIPNHTFYFRENLSFCLRYIPDLSRAVGLSPGFDTNVTMNFMVKQVIENKWSKDIPWRAREHYLLKNKLKTPPPWSIKLPPVPDHFAHLSEKEPGMVSFTPDDEKGKAGRHTRMKPGRYLTKFYPDLAPELVEKWQARVANIGQIQWAITADEIEEAYLSFASTGVKSCMTKPLSAYPTGHCHPVRAYGDSDLALAYLHGTTGKVSARCLVWREKKWYGRIYGDSKKMEVALGREGYTPNRFHGARIKMIRSEIPGYEHCLVVPYVDNHTIWVDDEKKQVVLTVDHPPQGIKLYATSQHGYIVYNPGPDPRKRQTCHVCGDTGEDLYRFVHNDGSVGRICDDCREQYNECAACECAATTLYEHWNGVETHECCPACSPPRTSSFVWPLTGCTIWFDEMTHVSHVYMRDQLTDPIVLPTSYIERFVGNGFYEDGRSPCGIYPVFRQR